MKIKYTFNETPLQREVAGENCHGEDSELLETEFLYRDAPHMLKEMRITTGGILEAEATDGGFTTRCHKSIEGKFTMKRTMNEEYYSFQTCFISWQSSFLMFQPLSDLIL